DNCLAKVLPAFGAPSWAVFTVISAEQPSARPATAIEHSFWLYETLSRKGGDYNMPFVLRLTGDVVPGRIGQALQRLVDCHASLRTTFANLDGVIRARTPSAMDADFATEACASMEAFERYFDAMAYAPFDLVNGPLHRFRLVQCANDHTWRLIFVLHHLICDAKSVGVLFADFWDFYFDRERMAAHASHYGALDSGNDSELGAYWREMLAQTHAQPSFGRVERRAADQRIYFRLGRDRLAALRRLQTEARPFESVVLLTLFGAVMAAYAGLDEICIAVAIDTRAGNRKHRDTGTFIRTVPVRVKIDVHAQYGATLQTVRSALLNALRHAESFNEVGVARHRGAGASSDGMFDILFNHRPYADPCTNDRDLAAVSEPPPSIRARATLSFIYEAGSAEGEGYFEIDGAIVEPSTARNCADAILEAIDKLDHNRDLTLGSAIAPERQAPIAPVGAARSTPGVVLSRILENLPLATHAQVRCGDRTLTHAALSARANLLSQSLGALGVEVGDVVAIRLGDPIETLSAMLAAHVCGAAFCVLDERSPAGR
ncbi:MAG: condensation domain-containing protein, partial [Terricaulis sp.]